MFKHDNIQIGNISIYIIKYNQYFTNNDYYSILHPTEQQRIAEFSSIKRKMEFISTRVIKEQIFPGKLIQYSKEGAPFISGMPNISISHCLGCSAIATCDTHIIGLDIEPMRDKALRLHQKFLSDSEQSFLDTNDEITMTRAWSCKESLLKLSGRKGIVFKRDLIIDSYDGNELFTCSLLKNGQKFSVNLTSKIVDQMILTINHTHLF